MPFRESRPDATRQAVMDTALAFAMLRPTASLDEIALAAGVGRATLFRHFPNRTTLLREAGRRVLGEVEARLAAEVPQPDTAASARRALDNILSVPEVFAYVTSGRRVGNSWLWRTMANRH